MLIMKITDNSLFINFIVSLFSVDSREMKRDWNFIFFNYIKIQ